MDPVQIDRNLQALKAVEEFWTLPPLPDNVKLDLASLTVGTMQPGDLQSFMYGLDRDYQAAKRRNVAMPGVLQSPTSSAQDLKERAIVDPEDPVREAVHVRTAPIQDRFLRDLVNSDRDSVVHADATSAWKERAVGLGYLPEDTPINNVWDPAFNSVMHDMRGDDFSARYRGDTMSAIPIMPKPGDNSTTSVLEIMDDWLSPTGLMKAAVALDFLPDLGKGGDIRKIGWNPKSWWSAVDDVAMPMLNLALIATGVGEISLGLRGMVALNKARGGLRGLQALRAAGGAERIGGLTAKGMGTAAKFGRSSRVGQALGRTQMADVQSGAMLERMVKPGMLGQSMQKGVLSKSSAMRSMGHGMEAWRGLQPVAQSKNVVSAGMRLGAAERLERATGLDRDDGISLADLSPETADFVAAIHDNPATMILVDGLITPVHAFAPGQLKAIGSPIFEGVPAMANIGKQARFLDEAEEAVATSILRPKNADPSLAAVAEREATYADFQQDVKRLGRQRALAERMGLEDNDGSLFGGAMTFAAVSAGLRIRASQGVGLKGPLPDMGAAVDPVFDAVRNNLINQMRYIDPGDYQEIASADAWARAANSADHKKKLAENLLEMDDPAFLARMDEAITKHNIDRIGVIADVMEEATQPGVIAEYMATFADDMGDFSSFARSMDEIGEAYSSGHFAEVVFKEPADGVELIDKLVDTDIGPARSWSHDSLAALFKDPEFEAFQRNKSFSVFQRRPSTGRVTVARKGTITKQDQAVEYAGLQRLKLMRDTARELKRTPLYTRGRVQQLVDVVQADFADHRGVVAAAHLDQIMAKVDDMSLTAKNGQGITGDTRRRLERLVRYAIDTETPMTLDDIEKATVKTLSNAEQSDIWVTKYGLYRNVDEMHAAAPEGKQLLGEHMKRLRIKMKHTAGEIEVPEHMKDSLDAAGYKLVHGVEFLAPNDVLHNVPEIGEIVDMNRYRESLGLFGTPAARIIGGGKKALRGLGRSVVRTEQSHVAALYARSLDNSLTQAMFDVDPKYKFPEEIGVVRGDLDFAVEDVAKHYQEIVEGKQYMNRASPMRMVANLRSTFSPATPHDLVRTEEIWKRTIRSLNERALGRFGGRKYTDAELNAIYKGLKKSRVVGPQTRGTFTNWRDQIQAEPNLTNTMRMLSSFESSKGGYGREGAIMGVRLAVTTTIGAGLYAAGKPVVPWDDDRSDAMNVLAVGLGIAATLGMSRYASGRLITAKGTTPIAGRVSKLLGAELRSTTRMNIRGLTGAKAKMPLMQRRAAAIDAKVTGRMKQWTYTADAWSNIRDYMRFSLSPIFDASRFSEAHVLARIAQPESVTDLSRLKSIDEINAAGGVRLNMSPSNWKKRRMKATGQSKEAVQAEWVEVTDRYSAARRALGDVDMESMDAATTRFRQIGVLGFNTHEWEASIFADLTRIHGMTDQEAYKVAKSVFTYGINPRSGMEMNVNAVFFPFSFMKKTMTHATEFLSNDWSRTTMLHNALKTYEVLDERYDLEEMFKDHAPAMEHLRRLNIFAQGISPGQFGGPDRPMMNWFVGTPMGEATINPILNAIASPIGVTVESEDDIAALTKSFTRLAPVYNDVAQMTDEMKEQGYVFFGDTWQTKDADAREGYVAMDSMRSTIDAVMREGGETTGFAALRKAKYRPIADYWRNFVAGIEADYPGFAESRLDTVVNSVSRDKEARALKEEAQYAYLSGIRVSQEGSDRMKLGALLTVADNLEDKFGGMDFVPPEAYDAFLEYAVAATTGNDAVRVGYRSHLRRKWGPIESEIF